METFKQLVDKINQLSDDIKAANSDISEIRVESRKFCPVKIGDIVECNAYTHTGKKILVESIHFFNKDFYDATNGDFNSRAKKAFFRCQGRIIKVNGEAGMQRAYHYCTSYIGMDDDDE